MKLRNPFKKKPDVRVDAFKGTLNDGFRHFYFLTSGAAVCKDPERLPDYIRADGIEGSLILCPECSILISTKTEELRGFI